MSCPEAAQGGPIAFVEEGDMIAIDITNCRIDLLVDEATLAARKAKWVCPEPKVKTGYLGPVRQAGDQRGPGRGAGITALPVKENRKRAGPPDSWPALFVT